MGLRDLFTSKEKQAADRAAHERAAWEHRERAQREQDYMAIHGVRDLGQARDQISALDKHNAQQDRQRDRKISEDTRGYAGNGDRVFMSEHARGHHDQRGQSTGFRNVIQETNDRQAARGAMSDLDRRDTTFTQMETAPKHAPQQTQAATQVHQHTKGRAQ